MRSERRGVLRRLLVAVAAALSGRSGEARAADRRDYRRVVTGVGADGRSTVLIDGPVPPEGTWVAEGQQGAQPWLVERIPVDLGNPRDPIAGHALAELPPPGGAFFRIFTWQPGVGWPMHRTPTVDFLVVVSGRLELILETGSVNLGPGDCLVQRGTQHAWRVKGDQPCTFAAVFLPSGKGK